MDKILKNIYSDSNPFAFDPTVTFTITTVVTVHSIIVATGGSGGGDVVLSKTVDEVLLDEGNLQLVNFTSSVAAENSRIYLDFQLNTKIPSNRLIYSIGLTGMLPSTVDYRLTKQQYHTSTSVNYNTGLSHSWYKNKDVSLGSWFIGLDVEHIDERSLCCGTPPRSLYNNAKKSAETPNFEAHELEVNDLQETVVQYL
ncbi:Beta-1,3-galactosyltransferase 7 [Capsicum baccatum]|uniref:Beta-1,3-galactosyltransferase 7 n=1 Tax=Capsicum baccatum TaxID=33114 RepID=A0A2G2W5P0_CAPBA|nr:Beta-1,3-galactosyltransferase 7 [Capsicum baccatum]